jgi:hypothetical protein
LKYDSVASGNEHDSAEPARRGFLFDQRIYMRVKRAAGGSTLCQALGRCRREQRQDGAEALRSFGHG